MNKIRVASILFFSGLAIFAQSERGSITGLITDPTGAAIAGAELSIVNRDTNAVAKSTTTSTGEFTLPNLPPGNYRVEITASGFKASFARTLLCQLPVPLAPMRNCKLVK